MLSTAKHEKTRFGDIYFAFCPVFGYCGKVRKFAALQIFFLCAVILPLWRRRRETKPHTQSTAAAADYRYTADKVPQKGGILQIKTF